MRALHLDMLAYDEGAPPPPPPQASAAASARATRRKPSTRTPSAAAVTASALPACTPERLAAYTTLDGLLAPYSPDAMLDWLVGNDAGEAIRRAVASLSPRASPVLARASSSSRVQRRSSDRALEARSPLPSPRDETGALRMSRSARSVVVGARSFRALLDAACMPALEAAFGAWPDVIDVLAVLAVHVRERPLPAVVAFVRAACSTHRAAPCTPPRDGLVARVLWPSAARADADALYLCVHALRASRACLEAALHVAAAIGHVPSTAEETCARGAGCFDCSRSSTFARLSAACDDAVPDSAATVATLLNAGADVHSRADLALRHATEQGHVEVVRVLLERGANIHALNDAALRRAPSAAPLQTLLASARVRSARAHEPALVRATLDPSARDTRSDGEDESASECELAPGKAGVESSDGSSSSSSDGEDAAVVMPSLYTV